MDPEVAAKLRAEFPDGERWGWDSLLAEHSLFWNRRRQRLTDLSDRQILIALIWRRIFARQLGETSHLFFKEKELWERYFEEPSQVH